MFSMDLDVLLLQLSRSREKFSRCKSHHVFLSSCVSFGVVPKGMRLKFGESALPKSDYLQHTIHATINGANNNILTTCRDVYKTIMEKEHSILQGILYNIFQSSTYYEFEKISKTHHQKLKDLLRKHKIKKKKKMDKLMEGKESTTHRDKNTSTNAPETKKRNRRFTRRYPNSLHSPATQQSNIVVNLSNHILTPDQQSLLVLGPKFCPTPRSLNQQNLAEDIDEGCRRLRLKELFFDQQKPEGDKPPKFYKKTGYRPPEGRDRALDAFCHTLQSRIEHHNPTKRPRDNLTIGQRKALNELRQLVNGRVIRITTADKGGAVVVLNTDAYIKEADRQLQDTTKYMPLNKDPTSKIAETSNDLVNALLAKSHINNTTYNWALLNPQDTRCHQFYLLPKIHKSLQNPPGRPIISGVGGPTENLSKLVDHWLQPSVCRLPSHIKDTTDMLQIINKWNIEHGPFPKNTKLVTIDVVNLYGSIPHDEMLDAIRFYLNTTPPTGRPPTNTILTVAEHVLTNNTFSFEGQTYKQIQGTAMGTPMAPAAANLFMGHLETKLLETSPVPVKDTFWKRFIDDVFLLWTDSSDNLTIFLEFLNTFHPHIKFTSSNSINLIPFLDINIHLTDGYLQTDLYTKPTDAHAYLHNSSCHPRHTLQNMPFSQFLRLRRLCSEDTNYKRRCTDMELWFLQRGHKKSTIQQARNKADQIQRTQALTYTNKNKLMRTPFIITHHPNNPPIREWLSGLHKTVLHSSNRMKKAVPEPPVVGERNSKNIRSLLMPSVLPTPCDTDPGCYKCTKTCTVCANHLTECKTFTSMQTKQTFTIRHTLSCETENVIYILYCDMCDKCQYVGETKNKLKTRFYQHRSNINKNTGTLVTKHFNSPGHSLNNMKCIAIEQVFKDDLKKRLSRETFWIDKLKTLTPFGLNTLT